MIHIYLFFLQFLYIGFIFKNKIIYFWIIFLTCATLLNIVFLFILFNQYCVCVDFCYYLI